jgi:hypothetical protein
VNALPQYARPRSGFEIVGFVLFGTWLGLLQLSLVSAAEPALAGCTIERMPRAKHGETVAVVMHVTSDGSSCTLTPRVGKGQTGSISIIEPPKNGKLALALPSVVYTPMPGFAGTDTFLVAWFGTGFGPNSHSTNFRTRVEVQVAPK